MPLARAVARGADTVWVLRVGRLEEELAAPRFLWQVAFVAFEISRRHRVHRDLERVGSEVTMQCFQAACCSVTQPPGRICVLPVSHREQPREEIAVAPQGETKVFGGRLFATSPLFLEPRTRFGESNRELVDHIRHQAVRFVDAFFGIVDESRLHVVPARAKTGELIVGEQLSEPPHTLKVAATFHGTSSCVRLQHRYIA